MKATRRRGAPPREPAAEVAKLFEARAEAALAERGPAPLKPKGSGRTRLLKTDKGDIVTQGQLLQGLLKKAEIEAAVVDGRRPEFISCATCRAVVPVKRRSGTIPKRCKACSRAHRARGRTGSCASCGAAIGKGALKKTGKCHRCANGSVKRAPMSAEHRETCRKRMRQMNASTTPEQREARLERLHLAHPASVASKRENARRRLDAALPREKLREAVKCIGTRRAAATAWGISFGALQDYLGGRAPTPPALVAKVFALLGEPVGSSVGGDAT